VNNNIKILWKTRGRGITQYAPQLKQSRAKIQKDFVVLEQTFHSGKRRRYIAEA